MIKFEFEIVNLKCIIADSGFENIISEVNWKYKALDESGKLIIEMFGSENLGNPNYDNFTPFDVLTNEIVIGWLVNILSIKGEFESVSRIEQMQSQMISIKETKEKIKYDIANPKTVILNLPN
jgi:hypothetical protein